MNYCIKRVEFLEECKDKPRIPRPPNAFMLYANENRKKMSQLYPTESNKDISKRLGSGWKALDEEERKQYFDRAKAIGLQHKKEYPDYVYNPKEARIRKAMRDATRERSIGGGAAAASSAAMLSRSGAARRHSSWVSPHDELLMSPVMGPTSSLNGFGMQSTTGQYLGMNYTKMDTPLNVNSSMQNGYMQSNPLAQLQQQTEMWPDYHQNLRPRSSSGNPYMMGGDVGPYTPSPEPRTMLDKGQHQTLNASGQSPEMLNGGGAGRMENKASVEGELLIDSRVASHPDNGYLPSLYENGGGARLNFEPKLEDGANKVNKKTILNLPLSSQTLSSNLFSNDLKYQNNYILEYFQGMPSMTLMNITTPNGTTFPYATYSPINLADCLNNEAKVFENISEPNFFNTDIGFVPLSSM